MAGAGGVGGSTSGAGGGNRSGGCGGSSPSGKGIGGSSGSPGGSSNKTSGASSKTASPSSPSSATTKTSAPAKTNPSTNFAAKTGINRAPMTKAALNAKFDAKAKTPAKTAAAKTPTTATTAKTKAAKTASVLGPTSLKNLSKVNPQLASRVKAMAADLAKKGIKVAVTDGFRTKAQQKALYAQGRQPLSTVNAMRKAAGMGPITAKENRSTVTKSKSGKSLHNFGLAVDVVPVEKGRPTWKPSNPSTWNTIAAAAKKYGLTRGPAWDKPHYELRNGMSIGQIMGTVNKSGLGGLWNSVNRGYPKM